MSALSEDAIDSEDYSQFDLRDLEFNQELMLARAFYHRCEASLWNL
jgi:hypothetical protein